MPIINTPIVAFLELLMSYFMKKNKSLKAKAPKAFAKSKKNDYSTSEKRSSRSTGRS
jgi:hypothetical protein